MVLRGVIPPTLTLPLRGGGNSARSRFLILGSLFFILQAAVRKPDSPNGASETPLPSPPLQRGGSRSGFTLVELLISIGIITVLLALLLPAIQRVRGAADKLRCASNLHQLGIAFHVYHNDHHKFPPGVTRPAPDQFGYLTFLPRLLPYLENPTLWRQTADAYLADPYPFHDPPHVGFGTPVKQFRCPTDHRLYKAQPTHNNRIAALTSYVGVAGTHCQAKDGMLFVDSQTSLNSIPDGSNFTLLVGERPPSPDFWFGWWYASVGQLGTGTPDVLLGAAEVNHGGSYSYWCPPGPYRFERGRLENQCDAFHFWSLHQTGAHYLMAGGNVHFFTYQQHAEVLPALATRNGREPVTLEE